MHNSQTNELFLRHAQLVLFSTVHTEEEKLAALCQIVEQPPTPHAASLLAKVVAHLPQALIRTKALHSLHQLEFEQVSVNAISEVWYYTRDPDLTDLLIKKGWLASEPLLVRVMAALQICQLEIFRDYESEILEPLLLAILDTNPIISERVGLVASTYLSKGEVLEKIWQNERYAPLAAAIIRRRWHYTNPLGEWVLLKLSQNELEDLLNNEKPELVRPVMHACSYKNSTLAYRAEQVLSQFKLPTTHAEMCRAAMENDNERLHLLARATRYEFTEPYEQALFYFLTRQWARYETLDFDRRLVGFAYKLVSEQLRKRIMEVAKEAGRIEFIELVATGNYSRSPNFSEISDNDWDFIVGLLLGHHNWSKMWELAFYVQPTRSLALVKLLSKSAWQPLEAPQQNIFTRLASLAQGCSGVDFGLKRLVQLQERWERYAKAGISLAIVPFGTNVEDNHQSLEVAAARVAKQLLAITGQPVFQATLNDFVLLQKVQADTTLTSTELAWLQFVETLVGWRFRHEIEVEEVNLQRDISGKQFDIIIGERD
jgi:hypothetical protein